MNDAVHRKDRVEIIRSHDHGAVGVLQRCSKATTHHIAEHIKDHHVCVFQQVMLFEQLHSLSHHVATTAGTRRWAACFHTHHAVVALEHKVFDTQFLGVKVDGLQHVDHRGQHLLGQREGTVMFGVTADLQDPFPHLGKGR